MKFNYYKVYKTVESGDHPGEQEEVGVCRSLAEAMRISKACCRSCGREGCAAERYIYGVKGKDRVETLVIVDLRQWGEG